MKILIIKTAAGFVDVTNAAYNLQEIGLARALNKKGHQCDVVYWGGKIKKTIDYEYDDGKCFHVFYLKALNILKNGLFFGLNKLAKKYDILHCGEYDQIQSWLLSKRFPEKLVIFHGPYYNDFSKRYNKKCKIVDKIFVPTYKKYNTCFDTKSNLSTNFLIDKGLKNVHTIGVGIDLEQLQAKKHIKSELSEKLLQLKEKQINILLFIGTLGPGKNVIFLIDIFYELLKLRSNLKLVIIGKGDDNYKAKCFEYIEQRNLKDNIIYIESVKQEFLPEIYSASDVFVLPTLTEIFGMVFLEAMYFNTPVVTTHNGGSDMLIENNMNGIIVDEFETSKWCESIIRILDDKEFADKIKENAHRTIVEKFTWDALSDKFLEVFKSMPSQK